MNLVWGGFKFLYFHGWENLINVLIPCFKFVKVPYFKLVKLCFSKINWKKVLYQSVSDSLASKSWLYSHKKLMSSLVPYFSRDANGHCFKTILYFSSMNFLATSYNVTSGGKWDKRPGK